MKHRLLIYLIILLSFSLIIGCTQSDLSIKNQQESILYVGTYTAKGSDGIYVYKLNNKTGELAHLFSVNNGENPSYLAIDAKAEYLYAVSEQNNYHGERTGAVRSFRINPNAWNLEPLSEQPSFGEHPCHITVTNDNAYVLLANYTSGSVSIFPTKDGVLGAVCDTALHVGSGPIENRQHGPHAHSVTLSPDGRFLYVMDLGIDKIQIYDLSITPGQLTPAEKPFVKTAPGAGPRHFTFFPKGNFAYAINELNSTITGYLYNPADGFLTEIETVPTLPTDFVGSNTCADIHITPDGRFLYGSNRGHESLAIFSIENQTGKLTLIGHESVRGKTPRNFVIDPTGTFLLVANQNSDNIVVFRIDKKTGGLGFTGHEVSVSMPVCLKIVAKN